MPRSRNSGMVVAREAIVITVGAKPAKYKQVEVVDRRTNQRVMINMDEPYEPEDQGVPYAFKAYQRVPRNHPAVKQSPHAFLELEEVDEELVVS